MQCFPLLMKALFLGQMHPTCCYHIPTERSLFQHSPFANRFITTHFDSLRAAQNTIAQTPSLLSQKTRDPSRFNDILQNTIGKAKGAVWFCKRVVWDSPSAWSKSYLWSEARGVTVPQYDLWSIFRHTAWSHTPLCQPQMYRASLLFSDSLLPSSFYPTQTFCH